MSLHGLASVAIGVPDVELTRLLLHPDDLAALLIGSHASA
jgi:hypothetical protein